MRISVIGTGYLGATHAAGMAELGHEVVGVDLDEAKIKALSDGHAPFHEPGLDQLLSTHTAAGRLRFTTSMAEAAEFADLHFLCVGTPQQADSEAADLTAVNEAIAVLATALPGSTVVVGKSTVPVGTADRLAEVLSKTGKGSELAWNPEFLREGFAVQDTLRPDRLVFGVESQAAEDALREVYAPLLAAGVPLVLADRRTAELVKVAANAFLATKISFINAMAEVCESAGADVTVLAEALSHDARIGGRFLKPGLGFGGGCLPKDIRAFRARAAELGVAEAVGFLGEVDGINQRRRQRMVDLAVETLDGHVAGRRIGVLGAAFKPDSDDIRDSPALDVASRLTQMGAAVSVYDPAAIPNARIKYPGLRYADSLDGAVTDADLVLLLTEWSEFTSMDPARIAGLVSKRRLLDGRNALDADQWRAAGWTYRALGRPHQ